MPVRPTVNVVVINTAMLWLATIVAASALWPIYESASFLVMVAVTLPVGSLVAILGTIFRWPAFVVVLTTVASFFALGVPLAVPTRAQFGVLPTVQGLIDLIAGVALGWKQLLTITLPVGEYEALLVPAFVLILVSTVVALTIALRSKWPELAVIPSIVVFLVATAFGPEFPDSAVIAPIALMVVVLFWLVWFRWYRRRAAIRVLAAGAGESPGASADTGIAGLRTVVAAAAIMAVASFGAVAGAAALPSTADRTVLRTTIVQPFDPRDYVSPLASFRSYLRPGTVDETQFVVEGLPEGGRIRLATLDTYDGIVFSVGSGSVATESGSFTRVPYRFDQSAVSGDRVTLDVAIEGYTGVWLPTAGQFESIEFAADPAGDLRNAFYYNDVTATAAVIGGLAEGDSYVMTAVVPNQPTPERWRELTPGSATVPTPSTIPAEVGVKLDEYTSNVDGVGEKLAAMISGLRAEGYISHGIAADEPASRSGHSADRIAELLSAPRMIGDAEQYAVAAALMADQLGFPARVVVGFVPQGSVVKGSDVSAWIEVSTAQYGWVSLDPTPPFREIPDEQPPDNAQVSRPPTIVPPPVVDTERFDRQATPDSEQELPPDLDPVLQTLLVVLLVVGWGLLGAAIVVSPFLVIIAAKLRRRHLRRRAPSTLQRISGGWQEFEDAVIDHGLSPVASATRSEVAAIAGGVPSQVLAAVADRAIFSPDDPEASEADTVWRAVDELHASLDEGLTRWQRVKARISVRSLGGYSVRDLFKR